MFKLLKLQIKLKKKVWLLGRNKKLLKNKKINKINNKKVSIDFKEDKEIKIENLGGDKDINNGKRRRDKYLLKNFSKADFKFHINKYTYFNIIPDH